ncbi:hypothetical protein Desti_2171 [Desulfomonile tiedjei DSM 6799]|uniref:Uncharacterized protein n=1 Tax=Desulfomonile tiedjei (strain ATCC 49306 / DSM 6799 / DCB-1) TaxID=706587 RepID=I4C5M7_DESTA|nr:hypothetical protein Desti_2171 [Desulfomonile tiedjei DSM 6799]
MDTGNSVADYETNKTPTPDEIKILLGFFTFDQCGMLQTL